MVEKAITRNAKQGMQEYLPHHHPAENASQSSAAPDRPRGSKYAKISLSRERELGAVLTAVRTAAQVEAEALVDARDPKGRLGENERKTMWLQAWKSRARKDPDFVAARDELAQAYDGLGSALARPYLPMGEIHEDALQAARERLLEGAETYDPAKGVNFGTSVRNAVYGGIVDALRENNAIHVPEKIGTDRKKYIEAEDILAQELHRMPSAEEIANRLTEDGNLTSRDKVDTALRAPLLEHTVPLVLEGDLNNEYDGEVVEEHTVADPAPDVADQVLEILTVRKLVSDATLNERQSEALFGIVVEDKSLGEIAEKWGTTRSNVDQSMKRSVNRIRLMDRFGRPTPRHGKNKDSVPPEIKILKQYSIGRTGSREIVHATGLSHDLVVKTLEDLRVKGVLPVYGHTVKERRSQQPTKDQNTQKPGAVSELLIDAPRITAYIASETPTTPEPNDVFAKYGIEDTEPTISQPQSPQKRIEVPEIDE